MTAPRQPPSSEPGAARRIGVRNLAHYDRRLLRGDVVGGITVTAYLIPQVMAYATLAGLPAQTGLVVVAVTMVAYALIGSSRVLSVGPESTTALMTAAVLAPLAIGDPARYAALATLLALLVAVFAFVSAGLRLGFIGDLLSKPVLVGYMAGVAVIMIASQLGKLTGVDVAGDSFVQIVSSFLSNVAEDGVSVPSLLMGTVVAACLLVFSPRYPRVPVPLVVILAATVLTAVLGLSDGPIATVGDISLTTVHLGLPAVGIGDVQGLILPAVGIFIVAYTDNLLTARALADRTGDRVHNNLEFVALGGANTAAGLVGGFPVSSSASRAVIAQESGARSQMYSVVAAVLTVVSVVAFASVIGAFPTAALAGLVIYAAIRLVNVAEFRRLLAFRRREFALALFATFGVLAFNILYGVLAAIAISTIELLTRVARPHAAVLGQSPQVAGWHDIGDYPDSQQVPGLVVFRFDSPLFFANADNFVRTCLAALDSAQTAQTPPRWLLLNMEAITEVDITGLDALDQVRSQCVSRGITLALVRVKSEVIALLVAHGVGDRIGDDRIFPTLPVAVAAYEDWAVHHPT